MKGNNMSKVYKPIDLVSTENDYKAYAIVMGGGKEVIFLKNSQELKELFEKCSEDELSIYALQSVVRAQKVNDSDDYDDDDDYNDYDDDENSNSGSGDTTTDINKTIDEITQTFNSSLKAIISKIK